MTIAFALQGYAFWSISLSTLYIFITSIWAIHFLIKMDDQNDPTSLLVKLAVFSYLGSNIGPFALSGGTMYGESWITFWITYYLHSQFSLWIPLGVLAILFSMFDGSLKSVNATKTNQLLKIFKLMIWGYFVGSILQLETMSRTLNTLQLSQYVGVIGSIIVISTSFYLVYILFQRIKKSCAQINNQTHPKSLESMVQAFAKSLSKQYPIQTPVLNQPYTQTRSQPKTATDTSKAGRVHVYQIIILTGLLLFAIKSILQLIASIPEIGQIFTEIHFLKIGYTHLLLLGSYSFILIGVLEIIKIKINLHEAGSHTREKANYTEVTKLSTSKINSTGIIIFMIGSLSMILLLMTIGISQYLGIFLDFNIQFYLFLTGVISLVGYVASQQ